MTTRGFAGRIWRWWHAQAGGSFRRARVPLLLMLVPVVLGLGTWGFLAMKKPDYDVADSLYRSVTLFGFGGAVEQRLPLQLNVARFVAPLITGYAAVGA
ncbi:MAG: hypothetical protein QOG77_40, partial [Solirubrobacteraceae bacterium]|nr:hypothetical protein [Solirubrobacteraceae bacterium]